MTQQEILNLIKQDKWMMDVLRIAEKQNLKDWLVGAGFVRDKVWDHLHGYKREGVETPDIDLVYFDVNGNDRKADEALSKKLKDETKMEWEIVNESYAHVWNNLPPYTSTEDAVAHWPEIATCIGVTVKDGELQLIAPHGIDDLVNLIVRVSPLFPEGVDIVKKRVENKKWLQNWPKLRVEV